MNLRTEILNSKRIEALKKYFKKEPDILLAFLFGSYVRGFKKKESDFDIAIYLKEKAEENRIKNVQGQTLHIGVFQPPRIYIYIVRVFLLWYNKIDAESKRNQKNS